MTLKTWLEKHGLPVPQKRDGSSLCDPIANSMHDQWANIEVPEHSLLSNDTQCAIKRALIKFRDWKITNDEFIDELCSLLPESKKVSVEDIEKIIFKRVEYQYLPKDDCYMIGSPKELAKAIADFINKNEKDSESKKVNVERLNEIANEAIGDNIGYFKDEKGVVDIVIEAIADFVNKEGSHEK